jgi:hypothetical protein
MPLEVDSLAVVTLEVVKVALWETLVLLDVPMMMVEFQLYVLHALLLVRRSELATTQYRNSEKMVNEII